MFSQITGISNDNLYKFIAIFGLLVFFTQSIVEQKYHEIDLELLENQKQIEIMNIQINKSRDEILNKIKQVKILEKNQKETNIELNKILEQAKKDSSYIKEFKNNNKIIPEKKVKEMLERINERDNQTIDLEANIYNSIEESKKLYDELKEFNKKIYDNSISLLTNEYELKKINEKINYINKISFQITLYRIIGLIITIIGFLLWYFKIQKYFDIKIKNT